jgi:hypothetical protein
VIHHKEVQHQRADRVAGIQSSLRLIDRGDRRAADGPFVEEYQLQIPAREVAVKGFGDVGGVKGEVGATVLPDLGDAGVAGAWITGAGPALAINKEFAEGPISSRDLVKRRNQRAIVAQLPVIDDAATADAHMGVLSRLPRNRVALRGVVGCCEPQGLGKAIHTLAQDHQDIRGRLLREVVTHALLCGRKRLQWFTGGTGGCVVAVNGDVERQRRFRSRLGRNQHAAGDG